MTQPSGNQFVPHAPLVHEGQLAVPAPPQAEIMLRKEWHIAYSQAFGEARQTNSDLSVILGDVNALKAVNDELGHDEGDVLLDVVRGAFASVFIDALRTENSGKYPERPLDMVAVSHIPYEAFEAAQGLPKGSIAGQIGGDEYAIYLPGTNAEDAAMVRDRIRQNFSSNLEGSAGAKYRRRGINVGLALGVASLQPDMKTATDLLRAADQAMYTDKMSQLAPLSEDKLAHLLNGLEHLVKAEVRPRDLPRYIEYLGAQGMLGAELELALLKPGTPQEAASDNGSA